MAKVRYHLAPQGPDICRADPSNPKAKGCPYGGASGSENHFNTMAEAEVAYELKMESEGNGLVATAATSEPRLTALQSGIKGVCQKNLDALVADSYYGVSGDSQSGYIADSSEALTRFKDAFIAKLDDEVDPEIFYEDDSDNEVIRSIYIPELDIEIENQNADEDMRELQEYRGMVAGQNRDYFRSTF